MSDTPTTPDEQSPPERVPLTRTDRAASVITWAAFGVALVALFYAVDPLSRL